MKKDEIKKALELCSKDEDCEKCPYCNHYRCDRALQKDSFVLITEQEQENKRLEEETSNIRKETAREILDMLYDMGIDKEMLECCRIFDVNGVSLAKQICEKYGVEIEK